MAEMNDMLDRSAHPVGLINPNVPPLTEAENTFTRVVHTDEKSAHSSEQELDEKVDSTLDEKAAHVNENEISEDDLIGTDPYVPFDDLAEERPRIITIRAMVLGCACGVLVNASNVYLGLKTGWTFSANLFGAIIGFAVLKSLDRALPENFPILGGSFGPRENNIVQTAATAAGGLSGPFVSGIPALYQLGLLSPTPKEDFWRLVSLTIVGGYFGFAFATPLRKFFIIYLARELRLVFPTPSATALTIRSMHGATTGESIAKMKMWALSLAFSGALIVRVVSQYALGFLWDWHVFTWFFIWGRYNNQALSIESWGWYIEWTPAFIGSGILVGLNASVSFLAGSVLAWGIIGPTLVKYNAAFFSQPYTDPDMYDPVYIQRWGEYRNYFSLSSKFATKDHPSPRYWMLWPGVLLMIVVSFAELAMQWRIFYFVGRAMYRGVCKSINDARVLMKKSPSPYLERVGNQKETDIVEDMCTDAELVKWWMWAPLLVITIVCTCVVLGVQYGMPVGMSLLSVVLAFFFSILAVQCAGVTDVTPLTAASKASQIVLGGATKGEGWAPMHAQQLNLLGGSIASMGAGQASDLVSDFRTGFLLRTPPNQQWIAQGLGTICAVFIAPALFMLFTQAYPCVLNLEAETCAFSGPSISAWRAVAVAMTDPTFPVPTSSGIFSIVFSIFGAIMIVIREKCYVGRFAKYRQYHPNMMCIGLAFVLPQTVYGTAMTIGAIAAHFWAKRAPKHFDIYGFAVAAGLIAGEGIGGVINAIFQVAGIAGPDPYGTQLACPGESC